MSKTDKTAPYWVKMMYEPRFLTEVHDHRFHDCNLPSRPATAKDIQWHGGKDRPCFWYVDHSFWRSRWGKCPCWMCHGSWWDELKQSERRKAKRYCRDGWRDEY